MFCNDLKLCHIWPETKRKMVHLTSRIDSLPDRNMFMIRLPQALKGILIVTVFRRSFQLSSSSCTMKPRLLRLMHYSLFSVFIVNHPVFLHATGLQSEEPEERSHHSSDRLCQTGIPSLVFPNRRNSIR